MLLPQHQGQGIGTQVLDVMLARAGDATVRLDVLQRSEARPLYERRGFVLDHEDAIDAFLVRPGRTSSRTPDDCDAPSDDGDVGTINGIAVTDAMIQAWADEAERGYDPERLRLHGRTRPGRDQ